jgi:hypothetical protein
VADLAADAPAALARVLRPVRARHAPGVDAIEDRERPAAVFEELARLTRVRREATVEADHQPPLRTLGRFEQRVQLLVVERERLLDEHVEAALKPLARKLCVRVVARGDDEEVDVLVTQHLVRAGDEAREAVAPPHVARRHARRRRD